MPEETANEAFVRELCDRWNDGDRDAILEAATEETELNTRLGALRGGNPYVGPDGVREWMADIDEQLSGFRVIIGEMREVQPGSVLVTGAVEFRGRGSDIPWEEETAWILEVDGRVLRRMSIFNSTKEALAAAGEE